MKTLKKYTIRITATMALLVSVIRPIQAQVSLDAYYNIDWQLNIPSNKFVDRTSGWGMNFDAGWYLTPDIAIGAFMNYHTNTNMSIAPWYISLTKRQSSQTNNAHSISCPLVSQSYIVSSNPTVSPT
jgi:hypothetical protein